MTVIGQLLFYKKKDLFYFIEVQMISTNKCIDCWVIGVVQQDSGGNSGGGVNSELRSCVKVKVDIL